MVACRFLAVDGGPPTKATKRFFCGPAALVGAGVWVHRPGFDTTSFPFRGIFRSGSIWGVMATLRLSKNDDCSPVDAK
jgi:hypothetical protein